MKPLTKAQRAELKQKFGGHCAYCGVVLGDKWHADHIEAIYRDWYNPANRGKCERPENHTIDNMNPSCAPCNIDKHAGTLEGWRGKLQRTLDVLNNNSPTYRHAVRFGMLEEKPAPVVFYFERAAKPQPDQHNESE